MRRGESWELRPKLGGCQSLLIPNFRGAGVSPRAGAGGVPGEETGVKGKEDLANRSGLLTGSGSEIPVVSKHWDVLTLKPQRTIGFSELAPRITRGLGLPDSKLP